MDFDKLHRNVLNLDSSIRYAAIQNNTGVKISGGFRDNVTPILSDDELQMMHYYASQRWQTRKNIEHKIGPAKYAMAEYDEIKRISFPIDEKHLLMITTDVESDHSRIIKGVLELIHTISKK
ncbi:hypothetical protein NsoK4_06270 [Nitrosopumilus sp. K4]|uniref:DUF6659 family protein n=1 Tax=Nitrosopumilus sp. K4 TaxID=2795383 RepID=UPI001BA7E8FC|nr:DUF6659 family protein [Nitrosopumilus sp. K4]QUC64051.1 hypothetical protein NsoK4_06270 [Nitrosopumilus sp. K4]